MTLINAALIWTAVSAIVAPVIGSQLARRRVQLIPEGLVTATLREHALTAPPDR
jgi:hypothetical protein